MSLDLSSWGEVEVKIYVVIALSCLAAALHKSTQNWWVDLRTRRLLSGEEMLELLKRTQDEEVKEEEDSQTVVTLVHQERVIHVPVEKIEKIEVPMQVEEIVQVPKIITQKRNHGRGAAHAPKVRETQPHDEGAAADVPTPVTYVRPQAAGGSASQEAVPPLAQGEAKGEEDPQQQGEEDGAPPAAEGPLAEGSTATAAAYQAAAAAAAASEKADPADPSGVSLQAHGAAAQPDETAVSAAAAGAPAGPGGRANPAGGALPQRDDAAVGAAPAAAPPPPSAAASPPPAAAAAGPAGPGGAARTTYSAAVQDDQAALTAAMGATAGAAGATGASAAAGELVTPVAPAASPVVAAPTGGQAEAQSPLDRMIEEVIEVAVDGTVFVRKVVADAPRVVSLSHVAWCAPLSILMLCHFCVFSSISASDERCEAQRWQPMVPPIAELYIHHFGHGLQVQQTLRHDFGGMMFVNILGLTTPSVTLPTMNHVMSQEETTARRDFFLPNYFALSILFVLSLELLRLCVPPMSGRLLALVSTCQPAGTSTVEQKQAAAPSLTQQLLPPSEEAKATGESPAAAPDTAQRSMKFERQAKTGWRFKTYVFAFCVYYTSLQLILYVWVDVTVAGGLMNLETGAAFEMWSLGMEVELLAQALVCLATYALNPAMRHQHPALLVPLVLLPIFGNIVHIMKDHLTQGLSFMVARCTDSPSLSWVALCLGYAGFAATIASLWRLAQTQECREGLRAAHWPVAEAVPARSTSGSTMAKYKEKLMSSIVCSCTQEKQVRAIWAEVPHTLLHVLFVFFFGGSAFMWFAIFLSTAKIFWIPVLRELLVIPYLATWKCSESAARILMINFGATDHRIRKAVHLVAEEGGWTQVLEEFYAVPVFVPQVQYVNKQVPIPVTKQVHVPVVQKVQKMVEVPQIEYVDAP